MPLSSLDLDARRLETRANKLISRLDINDSPNPEVFEDAEPLRARYDEKTCVFHVEDEMMDVTWSATCSHALTQKDWDEMYCYISGFSLHGCSADHEHYSPIE